MAVQEAHLSDADTDVDRSLGMQASRVFGLAVIGALAVVLAISFGALIFKGPLAADLGKGTTLMLVGGCALGLLGAAASSIRGAVLGMQDAPAIILALGASSIAVNWSVGSEFDLFSTVAMLIASASVVFGVSLYFLGRFHLGSVVRFLPYPVIGGFMAATGWFLFVGALGTMTGAGDQTAALASVLTGADWLRWAPGVAIGLLLLVASRLAKGWFALPAIIGGGFAVFYATLALSGHSLEWAGEAGLLLGPFPDTPLADALPFVTAPRADWGAVAGQSAYILTAVAIAVVGMLLNLSGAELATGRPADLDGDLRRCGLVNIASGGMGGGAGYILISLTLLARSFGVLERIACLAAGAACGLALIFGASLIGALPVCVFGGITVYLGADLLWQWLWEERRRLPLIDMGIVLGILVVAATVGFLEGVGVGVAASVAVFVHSRIAAPVVRRSFSNCVRFSTIERSPEDMAVLEAHGAETRVYQVEGVLFFGTIAKLAGRIAEDLAAADPPVRRVIVDLEHVQDLDSSAIHGIAKAIADCRRCGVDLSLAGLRRFAGGGRTETLAQSLGEGGRSFASLDDALEDAEEETLARHGRGERDDHLRPIPLFDGDPATCEFAPYLEARTIAEGEALIRQNDDATDMFLVRRGALTVELDDPLGGRIRVGVHFAGSVIGEMALYTGGRRSADVVAITECEVLRLTNDQLKRMEAEAPDLAIRIHRFAAGQISTRLRRTNNLVGMLKA